MKPETNPPLKIFGIGLNKTGTNSLHKACQLMGLRSVHDVKICRQIARDLREGDVPKDVDAADAFFDFPDQWCYELLAARYPNAKFVLTTRTEADWINSRIIHVLENRMLRPTQGWRAINTARWSQEWREHHAAVREWFRQPGRPELLEMNIPAGDGWDKLGPFLGLPCPRKPFPHENRGSDKLNELADAMDNK